MSRRHLMPMSLMIALALVGAAGAQGAELSRKERDMVKGVTEAVAAFEVLEIDKAARALQTVIDAAPSPMFARRLRSTATLGVLAAMREHEQLAPMVDRIVKLAAEGDQQAAKDPEFFTTLVAGIMSDDRDERAEAYEDLSILGQFAVPQLLDLLAETKDPARRTKVILALRRLGPSATLPLSEALASDQFIVRDNAIHLLAEARDRRAVPELVRLYHGGDVPTRRQQIVDALAKSTGAGDVPTIQQAYRREIDRVLSDDRRYATAPSREWAPLWTWDAQSGQVTHEPVPRRLYRELLARRMIARGLAAGYARELTEMIVPLYLRVTVKLADGGDEALQAEADRVLHVAPLGELMAALNQALDTENRDEILIALNVLIDRGRMGEVLPAPPKYRARDTKEPVPPTPEEIWSRAFANGDPEVRYRAARAAVALRRPLGDPAGKAVTWVLLSNLRFALGVGRILIATEQVDLGNEVAVLLAELPADCRVVTSRREAADLLDQAGDYGLVLVDDRGVGITNDLERRGLGKTIPVIVLAPSEEALRYRHAAQGLVTLPIVESMLERYARALAPPAEESLDRANQALDAFVTAARRAGFAAGSMGGLFGELVARGDEAFRLRLLPVAATYGDVQELAPLFAILGDEDASGKVKLATLEAIGRILERRPSARTTDMEAALEALFLGDNQALARAAGGVLNVTPLSDEAFMDLAGRAVGQVEK